MLGVSVLGVVELQRDGQRIPVRPGKTTEVLVRLALEAGTMVRTERLIDDLWADEAVSTARNTLQTKVSRLRRSLGDAALVTGTSAGYTLHVESGDVDALAVVDLAERAAVARERGDPATAVEISRRALALFRGDVLANAGDGEWLVPHRARLEEVRLALIECRLAAQLDLGRSVDSIAELEALVRTHPLREALWASLVVALYREGRQADALRAYGRARQHLADELGLEPGAALQALERQVLLQDPALDPPGASRTAERRGNVPVLSSPMVGRDDDLAELLDLVQQHRLVTLVGTAGVGKTRLAIEVARAATADVWVVRLEAASDAATVLQTLAEALGVARATEAHVIDHLRAADTFLVLDNCEQIIDDVAAIATRLLDAAPGVRLLCTSQRPVGIDGEVVHVLDPLSDADSVMLFALRATAQRASFVLDDDTAEAVDAVCGALDGLPLAIELAAARTKTLSIEDIARRLHDRFALLSDPTSRRPQRRRALGDAIAWSYDLLFPDDQRGLWALSCFAGGAPLAAVEQVLAALDVPEAAAIDVVGRLADRSLVAVDVEGGTVRYRLLDSIRAFAADRLDASGCADAARGAHAAWLGAAAARAAIGLRGPEQALHLELARTERANIDAALAWAATHDPALGLATANGFGWAWFLLCDGPIGAERLRRAVTAAADVAAAHEVVTNRCTTAWIDASDDVARAQTVAEEALAAATAAGDESLRAVASTALAFTLIQRGLPRDVIEALDGCPAQLRIAGDPWHEAAAWILTAHASLAVGSMTAAVEACSEAQHLVRDLDDDWGRSHLDGLLGFLAETEGRFTDAVAFVTSAAQACGRLGFRSTEGYQYANLGRVQQHAGDLDGAIASLEHAIDLGSSAREMRVVALARVRLARALRACGERARARAAAVAADTWFRESGGGEGSALAAFLVTAFDADDGAPDAAARLQRALDDARERGDPEIEVLALDALALRCAVAGDDVGALELLSAADAIAPTARHLMDDADRVDAAQTRTMLGSRRLGATSNATPTAP